MSSNNNPKTDTKPVTEKKTVEKKDHPQGGTPGNATGVYFDWMKNKTFVDTQFNAISENGAQLSSDPVAVQTASKIAAGVGFITMREKSRTIVKVGPQLQNIKYTMDDEKVNVTQTTASQPNIDGAVTTQRGNVYDHPDIAKIRLIGGEVGVEHHGGGFVLGAGAGAGALKYSINTNGYKSALVGTGSAINPAVVPNGFEKSALGITASVVAGLDENIIFRGAPGLLASGDAVFAKGVQSKVVGVSLFKSIPIADSGTSIFASVGAQHRNTQIRQGGNEFIGNGLKPATKDLNPNIQIGFKQNF